MRRLFFLIIFSLLWADIYDLLLIESKLYPKIVKLNEQKENIQIAVLYKKEEKLAKKLKELLQNEKIDAKISKKVIKADAYIIFSPFENLYKEKKLIFGVYPHMIENVMITLYIGVKVRPYINLTLIKKAGIKINPIILKVSKIYE